MTEKKRFQRRGERRGAETVDGLVDLGPQIERGGEGRDLVEEREKVGGLLRGL